MKLIKSDDTIFNLEHLTKAVKGSAGLTLHFPGAGGQHATLVTIKPGNQAEMIWNYLEGEASQADLDFTNMAG